MGHKKEDEVSPVLKSCCSQRPNKKSVIQELEITGYVHAASRNRGRDSEIVRAIRNSQQDVIIDGIARGKIQSTKPIISSSAVLEGNKVLMVTFDLMIDP